MTSPFIGKTIGTVCTKISSPSGSISLANTFPLMTSSSKPLAASSVALIAFPILGNISISTIAVVHKSGSWELQIS